MILLNFTATLIFGIHLARRLDLGARVCRQLGA
jgi:hypothetical protein